MAIKVVVHGASGRMGQEIIDGLCREPDIQVVGAVRRKPQKEPLALPDGSGTVPYSNNLDAVLTSAHPDVLVDFSVVEATLAAVRTATSKGVNMVIGTTGLSNDDIEEIRRLVEGHKVGVVMAPNFALGAVLMMRLAEVAAKYMEYAEVIELHHHLKADAPSGTALSTARAMAQSRGKPFSYRAGQGPLAGVGQEVHGASIHSVRLPGLMAHQEVVFGTAGQTLSVRHDAVNRECYIPGIVIAVKEVGKYQGLVYGLDSLLRL